MEEKIKTELKQAFLSRDQITISTLRLLLAEMKNLAIAKGRELNDQEILSVIRKEIKKRQEAIETFRQADRLDLVSKEEAELTVLQRYLPS